MKQKIIEEDVNYVSGSKNYAEIEKYMRENIDRAFSADDYMIPEDNMTAYCQGVIRLS